MVPDYRFKAFLFDLDGTLLDTAPDLLAALNSLLFSDKKHTLSLDEIRPIVSEGSEGLIKLGLGLERNSLGFAEAKEQFLKHYQANLTDLTTIFDGISSVLEEIETTGRTWGIVTNKPRRFTIPLIEFFGWSSRAKCVICGDSLRKTKPSPEPLIEGANQLGVSLEECVYIGDAITDVEAARAAGMCIIVAGYGYVPNEGWETNWSADGTAERPIDLRKWLV